MGTLLVDQGMSCVLVFLQMYRMLILLTHRHSLIPPRGYSIAGISGSCGQWVDGFSLIITR